MCSNLPLILSKVAGDTFVSKILLKNVLGFIISKVNPNITCICHYKYIYSWKGQLLGKLRYIFSDNNGVSHYVTVWVGSDLSKICKEWLFNKQSRSDSLKPRICTTSIFARQHLNGEVIHRQRLCFLRLQVGCIVFIANSWPLVQQS